MTGTVRTFDESIREQIEKDIEKAVIGTCFTNDCIYFYNYERGYPTVINHKKETDFLAHYAKTVPVVDKVVEIEKSTVGEDFASYLQHVKGTFFFTGAKPEGTQDSLPTSSSKI